MTFQILFENQELIAIDKPAGLNFHSEDNVPGVAAQLQQAIPSDIYPVHRLDKMTSGVLLFAKSQNATQLLGKQFSERLVEKRYLALSTKKPKKKQGKIVGDMIKARNGSWKLSQTNDNPATTHFVSRSLIPGIRFFWITPTTGKTHQIRVALKSLGSPILGDSRYSGDDADRGYLHAYQLKFQWQNETINIISPPNSGNYFLQPECTKLIADFCDIDNW